MYLCVFMNKIKESGNLMLQRATKDKASDEHMTTAEMGNENADPASMPGADAGAIPESCAEAVAEKRATTKKTAKALNELMFAIANCI
ncbi:unnamed protein product [Camellia sinensis]